MKNEQCIADRVALSIIAKERPSDLFKGLFFDLREKAKKLKDKWSQQVKETLLSTLTKDLESKVQVVDVQVSLGQYRGSKFVTSAKVRVVVKNKAEADKLLTYLQTKYSPKYKLKNFSPESGEAFYNVR